jgi:hypothetical protein
MEEALRVKEKAWHNFHVDGSRHSGKTRLMASKKVQLLHPSSLQRTVSTPHSSGFARLELGAFYFAIEF